MGRISLPMIIAFALSFIGCQPQVGATRAENIDTVRHIGLSRATHLLRAEYHRELGKEASFEGNHYSRSDTRFSVFALTPNKREQIESKLSRVSTFVVVDVEQLLNSAEFDVCYRFLDGTTPVGPWFVERRSLPEPKYQRAGLVIIEETGDALRLLVSQNLIQRLNFEEVPQEAPHDIRGLPINVFFSPASTNLPVAW